MLLLLKEFKGVVVIKGVDRSYWPDQKKIKNVGSDLPRDLQVPGVTCRAHPATKTKNLFQTLLLMLMKCK